MPTLNYQSVKFVGDVAEKRVDALTVEEALYVSVNEKPFTVTMRSPGNDKELVRGLIHSEDICSNVDSHLQIMEVLCEKEGITSIDVRIPETDINEGYLNSRNLLSVASCGICGQTELCEVHGRLKNEYKISPVNLERMFDEMQEYQRTFQKSGGSHAAAVFDAEGELLYVMEDIGRHNAVDKIVGALILSNQLKKAKALLVSGRISYEIVIKAFRAKIPVLAAVSAPSSLAVDYAKELGITLFGFCRGENATCYANLDRLEGVVKNESEK